MSGLMIARQPAGCGLSSAVATLARDRFELNAQRRRVSGKLLVECEQPQSLRRTDGQMQRVRCVDAQPQYRAPLRSLITVPLIGSPATRIEARKARRSGSRSRVRVGGSRRVICLLRRIRFPRQHRRHLMIVSSMTALPASRQMCQYRVHVSRSAITTGDATAREGRRPTCFR